MHSRLLSWLCSLSYLFPQLKIIMIHFIYYQFKDERLSLLLFLALETNTHYLQIIYTGTIFPRNESHLLSGALVLDGTKLSISNIESIRFWENSKCVYSRDTGRIFLTKCNIKFNYQQDASRRNWYVRVRCFRNAVLTTAIRAVPKTE